MIMKDHADQIRRTGNTLSMAYAEPSHRGVVKVFANTLEVARFRTRDAPPRPRPAANRAGELVTKLEHALGCVATDETGTLPPAYELVSETDDRNNDYHAIRRHDRRGGVIELLTTFMGEAHAHRLCEMLEARDSEVAAILNPTEAAEGESE